MITSAQISHFKSIAEVNVIFNNLNIFVGANGVGKSNVIDAISFVHDCITEDVDTAVIKRHGIESIRQWSKTRPYHISIQLNFRGGSEYGSYRMTLSSARGAYKVVEEQGHWYGRHPFRGSGTEGELIYGNSQFTRGEDGLVTSDTQFEDMQIGNHRPIIDGAELFATSLNGPATYQNLPFRPLINELRSFAVYSIYPNTLRQPQSVSREDILLPDGANLATILRNINSRHRREKDSIANSMRVVMPQLSDITVKSAGGYYVPVIRVKEGSGEVHEFNMSQVSDGTLRVLGLLTAFYQPTSPKVIAVEEPEQMIHPGALPVIADAVKEFTASHRSTSRSQAFITTHSPSFIDLFSPEDIVWTNFRNGLTTCGRVNDRQLSLIRDQLFSAGEILTSEGFFG